MSDNVLKFILILMFQYFIPEINNYLKEVFILILRSPMWPLFKILVMCTNPNITVDYVAYYEETDVIKEGEYVYNKEPDNDGEYVL